MEKAYALKNSVFLKGSYKFRTRSYIIILCWSSGVVVKKSYGLS